MAPEFGSEKKNSCFRQRKRAFQTLNALLASLKEQKALFGAGF